MLATWVTYRHRVFFTTCAGKGTRCIEVFVGLAAAGEKAQRQTQYMYIVRFFAQSRVSWAQLWAIASLYRQSRATERCAGFTSMCQESFRADGQGRDRTRSLRAAIGSGKNLVFAHFLTKKAPRPTAWTASRTGPSSRCAGGHADNARTLSGPTKPLQQPQLGPFSSYFQPFSTSSDLLGISNNRAAPRLGILTFSPRGAATCITILPVFPGLSPFFEAFEPSFQRYAAPG